MSIQGEPEKGKLFEIQTALAGEALKLYGALKRCNAPRALLVKAAFRYHRRKCAAEAVEIQTAPTKSELLLCEHHDQDTYLEWDEARGEWVCAVCEAGQEVFEIQTGKFYVTPQGRFEIQTEDEDDCHECVQCDGTGECHCNGAGRCYSCRGTLVCSWCDGTGWWDGGARWESAP